MDHALYELHDKITPEFILTRIPETQIYERYLGIDPELGTQVRNPLRNDENPTCTFGIIKGKLVFRDWSESIYMDVFDVVQRRFKVGFKEALNIIAVDFGLTEGDIPAPILPMPASPTKSPKPRFDATLQPLTKRDTAYLKSFGITPSIASRFNIFSIDHLIVNNRTRHVYSDYDPALGYYFGLNSKGQQKWKIYFYTRTRHRFLCNTSRCNGWVQLPAAGPVVVLTKSLKDIATLYRLGIPATGTQGEAILPNEEMIKELKMRFGHIASLYDFDRTGIRTAATLRREYGITPFMLTDGRFGSVDYKSKDISDYVREQGLDAAKKLVNYALEHHIHGTASNINDSQLSAAL